MQRKIVETDGRGVLVERYVQVTGCPGRPLRGHGRPVAGIAAPVGGATNVGLIDGRRQVPLARAA